MLSLQKAYMAKNDPYVQVCPVRHSTALYELTFQKLK